MAKKGKSENNITISGGNNVVSTGDNAHIHQTNTFNNAATQDELKQNFAALREAIASLDELTDQQKAIVEADIQAIEDEVQKTEPNPVYVQSTLASLKNKLEFAGVIVSEVTTLSAPFIAIAQAAGIALAALGL